jgi:competence protein ComEC
LSFVAAILPVGGRMRQLITIWGVLASAGCLLIWAKAAVWGAPPLSRATFVEVTGKVQALRRALPGLVILPAHDPGAADRLAQPWTSSWSPRTSVRSTTLPSRST